jgi:non-ribosomal peptide synthetase component E (peptide arylation enzyme)
MKRLSLDELNFPSEFVEKIKESTHWQQQTLVPNLLAEQVDIWS